MAHASKAWLVQYKAAGAALSTYATIAAITSKGFSMSGGTIDVTADDDNGFRRLLNFGVAKALSLSVEGYAESYALRDVALNKTADKVVFDNTVIGQGIRFIVPDDSAAGNATTKTLSGSFIMTAYEETGGAPDGAVTFTASFEATGDWTYA